MTRLADIKIPVTDTVTIPFHVFYYVIEHYGDEGERQPTPEAVAAFVSFQDARQFCFMMSEKMPHLRHSIHRFSTDEKLDVGAKED